MSQEFYLQFLKPWFYVFSLIFHKNTNLIFNFINEYKNGVLEYDTIDPNFPITSCNIANINFEDNKLIINISLRSSKKTSEKVYADKIMELAKQYGIDFCFETGQETPTVILRTINDVKARGLNNLKINLDPANLLMYGKGNPMDAVDVFGQYVAGMHVKDGDYPTNGNDLGCEYKVGKGRVNFEYIIRKLHFFGYQGPLTIEREISGEEQRKDIKDTIKYLEDILSKID